MPWRVCGHLAEDGNLAEFVPPDIASGVVNSQFLKMRHTQAKVIQNGGSHGNANLGKIFEDFNFIF